MYIGGFSVVCGCFIFFFCKQKTAYEMRISDWSSDVCSSDLRLVDDVADLGHRLLEHAMGRRIGDHDGCKLRAVLGDLRLQVVDIDIPRIVAADADDPHPRKLGRRRVGAMRRRRDQADLATDRKSTRLNSSN